MQANEKIAYEYKKPRLTLLYRLGDACSVFIATPLAQAVLLSLTTLIDTGFTLCEPDSNQLEETLDEGEMFFLNGKIQ